MGVDLCGGNARVAEKLLDGADVGSPTHEVGREAVPEGVGGDRARGARALGVALDEPLDAPLGESAAPRVHEEVFPGAMAPGPARGEIRGQSL